MTAIMEDAISTETSEVQATEKAHDFSKFRPMHEDLANYVNAHSGLDAVTPNQVKAILTLRAEYASTPEVKAAREARKAEREAEKQKFAGLTPEEIKAERAARRAEKQAEKLQARVAEALAKAQALRENKEATGEDIASAVEEAVEGTSERKISRRR